MLAQETLQAVCPRAEAALDNFVFMGRDPRAFHRGSSVLGERQDAEGGGQEGGFRRMARCFTT